MHGTYNFWLVGLSLIVATLASYTAHDLSRRIPQIGNPAARQLWLLGGALAFGVGIWSMHFIGVLAFSLPIPLGYDFGITSASLLAAILVSYLALAVTARGALGLGRLLISGCFMGAGIVAMHYLGDAAMRMEPPIQYDRELVALSVAIAVAASIAALCIARWLAAGAQTQLLARRLAAACVMGLAITGMHYTGNAAANFVPGAICGAANGIDMPWLATTVTLLTLAILAAALMLSRFEARTAYLTGSVTELSGQVLRLATSDVLTGLANRRALAERLEAVIAKARKRKTGFALLFMDLDGFKTINDSLGHTAGDEVLRAFGRRLLECVPKGDMVARLGGDEFVVLAEHASSPDAARALAQAILSVMREPLAVEAHVLQIMPSIGIALFPPDGDSFDTLLKHADAAMYEAKRGGRGRFRFFEASMNEAAMRTFLIQHALQESLSAGYFSLHFQPKFASMDGALTGAEALLRLEHPKLGRLTPAEFIPIAERSGQIVQIGYWVVREACRQIVRWREQGLPRTKIAINLSPKQLAQDDLVTTILDIVRSQNVLNEDLMFEITETVAMHDARRTVEMVHAFQENGFEIAIDDFGTGYSSLAYLQRFRVRQLKIDRFFVDGLDLHGPEGSAIVSAIIALAHSLDMRVVAEGVETASQRDQLQALGCDQMQGFLLGKPEPADRFAALLRECGERQAAEANRPSI